MFFGSSKFWVGVLIGSAVGAMAYRCSQTGKAKEWKEKMCEKMRKMRGNTEEFLDDAKKKAADAGVKVADAVADKAEEARDKAHSFARNNN